MSNLHNEILEELMTINDTGNGQDEAIEVIINIVRDNDKHEHASFALECSEQARADERERCVQFITDVPEWMWLQESREMIIEAIRKAPSEDRALGDRK